MSSRLANKFPIPEGFPEILHDFAREVVRYRPKDIYDFSIQYFYSIEKAIPLNYVEGGSNQIPSSEATLLKEKSLKGRKEISTPSIPTEPATQNVFYKPSDVTNQTGTKDKENSRNVTPIESERNENSGRTSGRGQVERPLSTFSGVSGTSSAKQGVRGFVGDVMKESENIANNKLKENLEGK